MKRQVGLVRKCVIGVALSGAGWVSTGMLAQAAPAAEPVPYWWFHGTIEAGGRFFLNNPQKDGQAYLSGRSLAKYYEYSTIKPGPFSNVWLSTGSQDGLYQADFAGKNIGYSDQNYYLDLSQAGKQYLSLGWDQTPHVYSMSAQTPFFVNGNTLTLAPGAFGKNAQTIVPFEHITDIGISRDTASARYRWTPTDAWDISADYSHMRRTGTQIASATFTGFGQWTQLPRPVADTTQNYSVNGEYVGTSLWGQKLTAKVGYFGSQYTDDYAAYTVQNWVAASPTIQVSVPPSNNANGFNGTIAADLPWKSRYVGTVSYNMMRQDEAFIPMSTRAAYNLPAASLNGEIDTVLLNNVVTTKITPEITNKASYRYYDFNNRTPELFFANWIRYDSTATSAGHNIRSLSINYTKQNAGEELVWRPTRAWTLGAAYGYERYDWTRADADVTNEHSGKVFADWKPTNWLTVRSSGYYGNRRYENYDYNKFVSSIQFPDPTSTAFRYQSSYRQLMIDNRETWKAKFAVDLVALPGLTITPTFKYQDENYSLNPTNQLGLEDRRLWSGGVDATYAFNPNTSITVGYMRDYITQLMFGTSCTNAIGACATPTGALLTRTNDKATYDTVTALLRHAVIPNKLDTELRYAASQGIDRLRLLLLAGGDPSGGQFPDMTTWYQRLDAAATYKFDKEQIALLGWKGEVKAKLGYTWERNSVRWYTTDMFGVFSGTSAMVLAADNPNYNVHMLMASLAFTW
jgi:MtrB/PioB family decaheme-associated outer membrane protein